MSYIRTLLTLLVGLRLFGASQSSTESLFRAIQTVDYAAIKDLLSAGVNPNVKDADGTPALMTATLFADARSVQLLLDRGADPNAVSRSGATALMWAIPDIAKAKLLIAHGANVNARSTNLQRTPFLIAASYPGSVEILQLLVDAGADVRVKDRAGMHALGRAMVSA